MYYTFCHSLIKSNLILCALLPNNAEIKKTWLNITISFMILLLSHLATSNLSRPKENSQYSQDVTT